VPLRFVDFRDETFSCLARGLSKKEFSIETSAKAVARLEMFMRRDGKRRRSIPCRVGFINNEKKKATHDASRPSEERSTQTNRFRIESEVRTKECSAL
jgi:hypothetical protein